MRPRLTTSTVLAALTAPTRTFFGRKLHAVTLAHLVALEWAGVPFGSSNWGDERKTLRHLFVAGAMLSLPANEAFFFDAAPPPAQLEDFEAVRTGKFTGEELAKELQAVREHLANTWRPFIPVKNETGWATAERAGFIAEMTEFLMNEYKMAWDTALFFTPLQRIFILLAASNQRKGAKFASPTYTERDTAAALDAASDTALDH